MAEVIVANGAFKSGSTWIHKIVRDLAEAIPPPDEWLRDDWKNPSVHENRLEGFLVWSAGIVGPPFCFKAHYEDESHADHLESAGARVVDIQRDLRDVFVSAYFHYKRLERPVGDSLEEFYAGYGGRVLKFLIRYHRMWANRPNSFTASYERLQEDPVKEARRLADWLEVDPPEEKLKEILARYDFERLQSSERSNNPDTDLFYRSGTTGDWRNYLSDKMAREISALNDRLPMPL